MERTYTDTPEPRYVEKAKESETTSALPEPTIADAGKVLGVDEQGKYALTEGGGIGEVYIHITGYNESTNRPIYTILQRDPKFLEAILDEGEDYTDTTLIYRVSIHTGADNNIQVINYDGTLIVLNTIAKQIELGSCDLAVDADSGNYYILP